MFREKNPCKVTTNSQGKHYNKFTKKELQRIYKDTCLRQIYQARVFRVTTNLQGSITANLQGNDYNEFTRTRVLQGIYQARVFYYDEFTTTISESLKIKSLTPKVSYL